MNRLFNVSSAIVLFHVLLLLPIARATDIDLNDACSLADAIASANSDSAVGGCPAGDVVDTISLSGDITLTAALPLVTSIVKIEGNGYTIHGNGRTHIIGVNSKGTLTLNEVTMVGGRSAWGGAIGNLKGRVTITNSTITGNWAEEGGAIGNEGILRIKDSVIRDNSAEGKGGAIFNAAGKVTIEKGVFRNNSSRINGGAIFNDEGVVTVSGFSVFESNASSYSGGAIANTDGIVTVKDSSFLSNTAGADRSNSSGGAIFNNVTYRADKGYLTIDRSSFIDNSASENGGAIYNSFGDLTIFNSNFAGNSAGESGGGLYASLYDTADIRASTFFGNSAGGDGGGVYLEHAEILRLSIIAGNTGHNDCYGKLDLNDSNLIGDSSCYAIFFGDPMLGELVIPEDGSPPYFPLREHSPAIDATDSRFCPDTDIIGTPRPQGAACDIGAYEFVGSGGN